MTKRQRAIRENTRLLLEVPGVTGAKEDVLSGQVELEVDEGVDVEEVKRGLRKALARTVPAGTLAGEEPDLRPRRRRQGERLPL